MKIKAWVSFKFKDLNIFSISIQTKNPKQQINL